MTGEREAWRIEVPAIDPEAGARAAARQRRLTKPPGSLGELETLALLLASLQGRELPRSRPCAALLFASDHPVCAHGVSAYPQAVTGAMVGNFVRGGAAANVFARHLNVPLTVIDVGVNVPVGAAASSSDDGQPTLAGCLRSRHRRAPVADLPAGDLRCGEAMDPRVFEGALAAGRDAVDVLSPEPSLLVLGEMGIGNTTAASAVAAAVLGGCPDILVGPGTGVEAEALVRKRAVVRDAVRCVRGASPMEVLRRVGGREMAALVGAAARAVERRIPVLVDGFIVTSAMLAWVHAVPAARPWLLFSHCSREPGHKRVLRALQARPLLDLGLRLGEGSGALAALSLVDLACAAHSEMATFEEAGVPDRQQS